MTSSALNLPILDVEEDDLLSAAVRRGSADQVAASLSVGVHRFGDVEAWVDSVVGERVFQPEVAALFPKKALHKQICWALNGHWVELTEPPSELRSIALAASAKTRLQLGRLLSLRGELSSTEALGKLAQNARTRLQLMAAFFAGDYPRAAALGNEMQSGARRSAGGQFEATLHVLARLASALEDPGQLAGIEQLTAVRESDAFREFDPSLVSRAHLDDVAQSMLGRKVEPRSALQSSQQCTASWHRLWVAAVRDLTLGVGCAGGIDALQRWSTRARQHGFAPLALELEAALEACRDGGAPARGVGAALRKPPSWRAALARLDAASEAGGDADEPSAATPELLWMLSSVGSFALRPRIRTSTRSPKGRRVDLFELERLGCTLTAADDRIIEGMAYAFRRRTFLPDDAFAALVGHPRVVDDRGQRIRVELGTPRVVTTKIEDGVHVELLPSFEEDQGYVFHRSGSLATVYPIGDALHSVRAALSGKGSVIPWDGVTELRATLGRLAAGGVVHVTGDVVPDCDEVEADPRPVLSLVWDGEHLEVEATVAPVGIEARHTAAGEGGAEFSAEVRERGAIQVLHCTRDLVTERRALEDVERACPTMMAEEVKPRLSRTSELGQALQILAEVEALGDAVRLAWPKGRKLHRSGGCDLDDLELAVASKVAWLEVTGTITTSEHEVLGFEALLGSRASQEYVELGQDRFVALSRRLQKRLDVLTRCGSTEDGSFRVPFEASEVLSDAAASGCNVDFDAATRERLARLEAVAAMDPPTPPDFTATLRAYQQEGYAWLWRLSQTCPGACLADDMGLGKTIQTLALLAQRSELGAALVVCPTSVVHNWIDEIGRFAPALRVRTVRGSDRVALAAGDVFVCSYGGLANQPKGLEGCRFATAVFDEAQYVKNSKTRRAKAARRIQATFKLALSGTPLENRTLELWSLFDLLVPGLLGDRESFFHAFAKHIETGCEAALNALRALIRPFVLRRTKGEVLRELPPCTDKTVTLTPSPQAAAYYEALRRAAEEEVEATLGPAKITKLFGALTRLRQAAIDPRLLDREGAPAGPKIPQVVEHVVKAVRAGHQVLVFTQFLQSMAMIQEGLLDADILYEKLTGSMSASERACAVARFQRGDAPVFVLSLRAGGVGMNLTAADHVVHVDPWWNPAVEDQATDRAHRIGQTKPVSVVRFVTGGTVEEKLITLHAKKRDLADGVIGGLGGGSLDVETLRDLLR